MGSRATPKATEAGAQQSWERDGCGAREGGLSWEQPLGGPGSELGQTEEGGEMRAIWMGGRVMTKRRSDKYGDTLVGREKLFG